MARKGTNEERLRKAAEVKRLRDAGLEYKEIAERLGISRGYAGTLFADPTGTRDRERKRSYQGVCVGCGGPTCGSGGRNKQSLRCAACHRKFVASDEYLSTKTFWTRERVIEAIRWWTEEHGDPPSVSDFNPHELSVKSVIGAGQRARYSRRLIEERKIPWFSTVIRQFGTWNAAIEAAGFKPRAAHYPKKARVFKNGRPQRSG